MATDILRPAEAAPTTTDFLKDYHDDDDDDDYHDYHDDDTDDDNHDGVIADDYNDPPGSGSSPSCRGVSATNPCVSG